jgi:hypothetical protein
MATAIEDDTLIEATHDGARYSICTDGDGVYIESVDDFSTRVLWLPDAVLGTFAAAMAGYVAPAGIPDRERLRVVS